MHIYIYLLLFYYYVITYHVHAFEFNETRRSIIRQIRRDIGIVQLGRKMFSKAVLVVG